MHDVYRLDDLLARGLTKRAITGLVETGRLLRLRRGWYAGSATPTPVARAVASGGALTCVSALALAGAWTMPHPSVHVRAARGTAARGGVTCRVHWSAEPVASAVDDPATALALAITCLDLRAAVVVVDSVLNRGILSADDVTRILGASPRGRRVLALIDGRAESGIETLPRLALRARRVRVRTQVVIPGVGRVDLLIGDRLILECDGREWHADFEADRARDRALIARGYLVIRASYRQILDGWGTVEAQILALVRRREHLWRRTLPQGRRCPPSADVDPPQ